MDDLRNRIPGEIFDYQVLMEVLNTYQKPRDKVTRLLRSGEIVRVKKGLYTFGSHWQGAPIPLEVLANLIYGPSYISLEYALSYYGLIPEAVPVITSVTTGKSKQFETPYGCFSYRHLSFQAFSPGMEWHEDPPHSFLIASREKAIADVIAASGAFTDRDELHLFLTENLRIDEEELMRLRKGRLREIASGYGTTSFKLLIDLVEHLI